jgi:hypothetical protein
MHPRDQSLFLIIKIVSSNRILVRPHLIMLNKIRKFNRKTFIGKVQD